MNIIITKGLQASGKSTWAKQFITEHQDYKCVNRDSFRHMLSNYTFDDKNEKLVTKLEDDAICSVIDSGYNLVIDAMHLNQKYLDVKMRWIKDYCVQKHNYQVEFEIKEFPITLAEAIERDAKRDFPIGKEVLKNTFRKYEVELKQMIERSKPKNLDNENSKLPICILCDIDGTLADSTNRRIFDDSKVNEDKVINPIKSILLSYSINNYHTKKTLEHDSDAFFGLSFEEINIRIFIMSGRKDSCRAQTEEWLKDNYIPFNALYMRKANDNRKDTIVKEELFNEHIKGKYKVLFVIDDRKCVIEKWISMGLFVLDVSQDPYAKNNF